MSTGVRREPADRFPLGAKNFREADQLYGGLVWPPGEGIEPFDPGGSRLSALKFCCDRISSAGGTVDPQEANKAAASLVRRVVLARSSCSRARDAGPIRTVAPEAEPLGGAAAHDDRPPHRVA